MTVSPPKYGFPDNFPLILVFRIEKTLVKPIAAIFVVQESLHIYDLKILAKRLTDETLLPSGSPVH